MRCYRPISRVAALTFDLDDTLYDNHPVIARTEQESLDFVRRYHPQLAGLQLDDFRCMRQILREEIPEIYHDVTEWRRLAIERLMWQAGLTASEARQGSQDTMQHFAIWRSRIQISQHTQDLLAMLAKKWPLAVITNGNADPYAFGIGGYFRFILRAGPDGRAKPFNDMYQLACDKLALPAGQVLHIGDDLTTDVAGAIRHGLQACWFNPQGLNLMQIADSRLLPHIEIASLPSLSTLL